MWTEQQQARLGCQQCRRICWHTQTTIDPILRIGLYVTIPWTLGLSLIPIVYHRIWKGGWRCNVCGTPLKEKRETGWLKWLPYRHKFTRPNRSGGTYRIDNTPEPDFTFDEDDFEDYQVDVTAAPPEVVDRPPSPPPRAPLGSYADPEIWQAAMQSKPAFGHSDAEYWAWHDTLYLGGSWRSTEWKVRASQAKQRDGNRCVQCGATDSLETDHIIELSRGGSNDFDNLQTLCHECHEIKTAQHRQRSWGK